MNYKPFPIEPLRQALHSSLPQIEPSELSLAAFTYVPGSHARALDPENALVEGGRGAGKTFWWTALNSSEHLRFVAAAFPEARVNPRISVAQGFGTTNPNGRWPSKDTLAQLAGRSHVRARAVWRAVLGVALDFPLPFPAMGAKWSERTTWVEQNPEDFDDLLAKADAALADAKQTRLILFDALDRLADDWPGIRPVARALFQLALDVGGCRAIRLKLFLRPDMLEDDELWTFPDSSKLRARKVSLEWRRSDLYALLFQCLGNAPDEGGAAFRNHCQAAFGLTWKQDAPTSAWLIPTHLRHDADTQQNVFHAIAGDAMGAGPSGYKRGYPYSWLVNHLVDGRNQVSPRSFCAALRKAVEADPPSESRHALHFKSIHEGVQEASRIRVDEITREDYRWVRDLMAPLRGKLSVPCETQNIFELWDAESIIDRLNQQVLELDAVKLPPQSLGEGAPGVLRDLKALGVVQFMDDGRIQVPDVYRIAFGLGRRGGVKPLK